MNRTAFDDFFEEQLSDPERAQAYAEARAEIDAHDEGRVVQASPETRAWVRLMTAKWPVSRP